MRRTDRHGQPTIRSRNIEEYMPAGRLLYQTLRRVEKYDPATARIFLVRAMLAIDFNGYSVHDFANRVVDSESAA